MNTTSLPEPFPSLLAMRERHLDMLEQREMLRESPDYVRDVGNLIDKFVATGGLMESPADRRIGQSIIDYWTTELQRNGDPDASAVLAPYKAEWCEQNQQTSPYKGLEAFQSADHDNFHGRDQLIEQLCQTLTAKRLLTMLGESGSGKSSLLRAGVLFHIDKMKTFRIAGTILPGSRPLEALAALFPPLTVEQIAADPNCIAQALPDPNREKILVAVDQFEEAFTLDADEAQRQGFARALLRIWEAGHAVVITVREDLWDKCVDSLGEAGAACKSAAVKIPPMSAADLRAAIEEPARKAGLSFEAGLVDQLITDVENESSALPLLQFTLLQLWNRRQRNPWESEGQGRITWEAYRRLRGPKWALAETADSIYSEMTPESQQICRVVLLRLVKPTDNYEVLSSRERLSDVKTVANPATVQRVVDTLSEARLLRVTHGRSEEDDQIEVAHEALIRNWPRLIGWLNEKRLELRERFRLREVSQSWAKNHDSGLLWSGLALEAAKKYEDLSSSERGFVAASQAEADAKLEEKKELERRREERVRVLIFFLSISLVLLVGMGFFAVESYKNQKQAEENLERATANYQLSLYNFNQKNQASAAVDDLVRGDLAKQHSTTPPAPDSNKASAVYVILQDEQQRAAAEQMSAKLTEAGYKVGKPRVVNFGPDTTELRYFQAPQADNANQVAQILNAMGTMGTVSVKSVSWGKGDADWFEVWFGKPQ